MTFNSIPSQRLRLRLLRQTGYKYTTAELILIMWSSTLPAKLTLLALLVFGVLQTNGIDISLFGPPEPPMPPPPSHIKPPSQGGPESTFFETELNKPAIKAMFKLFARKVLGGFLRSTQIMQVLGTRERKGYNGTECLVRHRVGFFSFQSKMRKDNNENLWIDKIILDHTATGDSALNDFESDVSNTTDTPDFSTTESFMSTTVSGKD